MYVVYGIARGGASLWAMKNFMSAYIIGMYSVINLVPSFDDV